MGDLVCRDATTAGVLSLELLSMASISNVAAVLCANKLLTVRVNNAARLKVQTTTETSGGFISDLFLHPFVAPEVFAVKESEEVPHGEL